MIYLDDRFFIESGIQKKNCSELAAKDIGNVEECKVAAQGLNKKFSHVWTKALLPNRCHSMIDNDIVYWNNHPVGSASAKSSPICKAGRLMKHNKSIIDRYFHQ